MFYFDFSYSQLNLAMSKFSYGVKLLPYTATITKSEDNIYIGLGYKVDKIFENTLEKAEINHIIDFLKLLSDKSKLDNSMFYFDFSYSQLNLAMSKFSYGVKSLRWLNLAVQQSH